MTEGQDLNAVLNTLVAELQAVKLEQAMSKAELTETKRRLAAAETMATYKLFVATGNTDYAGTMDYAYVTVIGKSGQSERKSLNNPGRDHCRGCIKQKPHKNNPIFLPSDPELDWLLAKMWVRHAEFQVYEALSHLLRTHLVWEVFCIATMRQLPAVHPVYKLLIPHMRDTLQINTNARLTLISENGIFKQITSTGGEGLGLLLQKECQEIEFMSLLPKTDFEKRGVSQLKNYFYRDDCLKLWEAIESFVSGIVDLFYSSDKDVMEDKELQNWIQDVVTEGFKDLPNFCEKQHAI
ncbi:LX15B lipoxygenase, partial [Polypterus senegalus]